MIRWIRDILARRSPDLRREAMVLVTMHGAKGAWIEARDRRRAAEKQARWDASSVNERRHWSAVMREIERKTGYRHLPGAATRIRK